MLRIDLAPVDEDEHARRERLIVAAQADVRIVIVPLHHIDAENMPQHARNIVSAGTADLVRRDDLHIRRDFGRPLRRAGRAGGNRFSEQLLQGTIIYGLSPQG